MRKQYLLRQSRKLILLAAVLILSSATVARLQTIGPAALPDLKGFEMAVPQGERIRAPELTGDHGWLNTDRPLSLSALKGKVVLLDFWTYGCINCMHIIPDLKRLEKKYANELVVI